MEGDILAHAQNLSKHLNETCCRAIRYLDESPQLHHLLERVSAVEVSYVM